MSFSTEIRQCFQPGITFLEADMTLLKKDFAKKAFINARKIYLFRNTFFKLNQKVIKDHVVYSKFALIKAATPYQKEAHDQMLDYVENNILSGSIKFISPEQWLDHILRMHRILIHPKVNHDPSSVSLRSENKFYYHLGHVYELDQLIPKMSMPEFFWFKKSLEQGESFYKKYHKNKLSPDLIKLLNKHIHIPLEPQKITSELKTLTEILSIQLNQINDVILTAALIHQEILRIRPFDKFNGRIARCLMNIILFKHGLPIQVFDDRCEYYSKIRDVQYHPDTFYKYIKGRIDKTVQVNQFQKV
ncbi:MAG: Fic family protein [Parachlamydiales bacterium]|nr:Fic family protein [Parachlamydiales bacterium]